MVDMVDRTFSNLANAMKGGMIKRGQLFRGVREIEADLKKIDSLKKDIKKATEKGNAAEVIEDLKKELDRMVDCEKTIMQCIGILLFDAHNLNKHIDDLKAIEKQLEAYKLEGIEIVEHKTEEVAEELKEGLAKLAGMLGSEARSE